jgi:hypothetical protein
MKTRTIMPEIIELIRKGKQQEAVFCRVCGRDIAEVQKEIAGKKSAEYIEEHRRDLNKADLERHVSFYLNRKHGKDCGNCLNLTAVECKEIIRILRMRMEALEKKLKE